MVYPRTVNTMAVIFPPARYPQTAVPGVQKRLQMLPQQLPGDEYVRKIKDSWNIIINDETFLTYPDGG